MAELKPCPFCGGEASIRKIHDVWYVVGCDDCPCDIGRYWFYTRDDAIEAWNKRVEIDPFKLVEIDHVRRSEDD